MWIGRTKAKEINLKELSYPNSQTLSCRIVLNYTLYSRRQKGLLVVGDLEKIAAHLLDPTVTTAPYLEMHFADDVTVEPA